LPIEMLLYKFTTKISPMCVSKPVTFASLALFYSEFHGFGQA